MHYRAKNFTLIRIVAVIGHKEETFLALGFFKCNGETSTPWAHQKYKLSSSEKDERNTKCSVAVTLVMQHDYMKNYITNFYSCTFVKKKRDAVWGKERDF